MRVGEYFVGPPPAFGGRRPHAEAAASPQGWPPPKTSLFIQKVFDCKWYKPPSLPYAHIRRSLIESTLAPLGSYIHHS
jgi:hypothetical protein